MDVDNDPIDPSLLLQFTCLNTTDRDDLIKQFKELTEQVEDEKAEFFLEMNNWLAINLLISYIRFVTWILTGCFFFRNLQNSICAYFDFLSPSDLSMAVVQQPPPFDHLTPNIE